MAPFLAQQKAASQLAGLDLPSLLIMPVQRIPRYVLLLREALKQLSEPQGRKELGSALSRLEKVALEINEAKRASENVDKVCVAAGNVKWGRVLIARAVSQLVQIQSRMDPAWSMVLLQPKRRFLMELPGCSMAERAAVTLFVFTDLVRAFCLQCTLLLTVLPAQVLLAEDRAAEERLTFVANMEITRTFAVKQNGAVLAFGAMAVTCPGKDEAATVVRVIGQQLEALEELGAAIETGEMSETDALQRTCHVL